MKKGNQAYFGSWGMQPKVSNRICSSEV